MSGRRDSGGRGRGGYGSSGSGGGGGVPPHYSGGRPGYDDRRGRGGGGDDRSSRGRDFQRDDTRRSDVISRSRERPAPTSGIRARLEAEGLQVASNLFHMSFRSTGQYEWVQYHVEIRSARRVALKKGEEFVLDSEGKKTFETVVSDRARDLYKGKAEFATSRTRRVLKKLQEMLREEGKFIVTDGTNLAFSPKPLFDKSDASHVKIRHEEETTKKTGIYGPADTREIVAVAQVPIEKPFSDFYVRLDEKDDRKDPTSFKLRHPVHIVRFIEVARIPFVVNDAGAIVCAGRQEMIQHCVNVALKNTLMNNLLTFEKNPNFFYFHPDFTDQPMLGRVAGNSSLAEFCGNLDCAPVVGLMELARLTGSSQVFMVADFRLNWMKVEEKMWDKERGRWVKVPQHNRERAYLLKVPREGGPVTLAGVPIPSPRDPIPQNCRGEIENKLKKLVFHVRYDRGQTWEEQMKSKGWDDERIKRKKRFEKRNMKLWKGQDGDEKLSIYWAADDASMHSFEVRGKIHTVASYYEEVYGLRLKYPKMPIVRVSNIEYFPVEFLSQAFGPISQSDSVIQKKLELEFNDTFAGLDRVKHLHTLLSKQGDLHELLTRFNMEVRGIADAQHSRAQRADPPLKAKVLKQPNIVFKNNATNPNDGSWDLRNALFSSSAEISSIAIVDFAGGAARMIQKMLEACNDHGISITNTMKGWDYSLWEQVIVNATEGRGGSTFNMDPATMHGRFNDAKVAARNFFVGDLSNYFCSNSIFFKTVAHSAEHGNGALFTCWVIPPSMDRGEPKRAGLIFEGPPGPTPWETHVVSPPQSPEEEYYARVKYHIRFNNSAEAYVDVANFFMELERGAPTYYASVEGKRVKVSEFQMAYEVDVQRNGNNMQYMAERDVILKSFCHFVDEPFEVECPSLMIGYVPDNNKKRYSLIKCFSNFEFGCQSQVIVRNDKNHGNKQYWSNVALKINTKLSNLVNKAAAWSLEIEGRTGLPWVNEGPTLILGISMAAAQGSREGYMVVTVSGCLDESGIRLCSETAIQGKSSIVKGDLLRDMVKNVIRHFLEDQGTTPNRIVAYRATGHVGMFKELIDVEVTAIRNASFEIESEKGEGRTCNCDRGCLLCTARITYIVAQSQHTVRLLPPNEGPVPWSRRSKNVPSGTCMDEKSALDTSTFSHVSKSELDDARLERSILFESSGERNCDFILVAHGGLKGTSKPVYYRVLWNENRVVRPTFHGTPLTKEKIQQLTYTMGFLYGTATKVPRAVPVIQYASRTANTFLGYTDELKSVKKLVREGQGEDDVIYTRDDNPGDYRLLPHFSPTAYMPFHHHLSA